MVRIIQIAARMGLSAIPGGETYLEILQNGMDFPEPYDPKNSNHQPSVDFLKKEGIYEMWYPTDATHQAIELFGLPAPREVVTSLLSTPMDLPKIVKFLASAKGWDVEIRALQEFRHYFWNPDFLADAEKDIIIKAQGSSLIKTAVNVYKDSLGPLMLMHKMGHLPAKIGREEIFYSMRNIAFLNALEVDRTLRQGRHKAAAFREYFEVVRQSQDKLDEMEGQEKDIVDDFYQSITVIAKKFNPPRAETLEIDAKEVPSENSKIDFSGGDETEGHSDQDNP